MEHMLKTKTKTGTVAKKNLISTVNKLPQNATLRQAYSQKEEHG